MKLLYNDVDIGPTVQPTVLKTIDNAGGKPDSLSIVFSDAEGQWSKWNPNKNDTLQVIQSGFDTGLMYSDEIVQSAGKFQIKALSIPLKCKTARSKAWENVRFMEIVTEIAARYGFSVQTFNTTNHLYERVDQLEEADLAFLAYRCMLEGYALKINNNNLVIYDEIKEEQKETDVTIYQSDMQGAYEFKNKSTDIYSKCIVRSQTLKGYIQGEFTDTTIYGPTLKKNIYASHQDEANRWARGLLRSYNKSAINGAFSIDLNLNLAAGSSVIIKDIGMFDGKYFIDKLVHDRIQNRTKLFIRKPLEGY